jgi:hypothetical protein
VAARAGMAQYLLGAPGREEGKGDAGEVIPGGSPGAGDFLLRGQERSHQREALRTRRAEPGAGRSAKWLHRDCNQSHPVQLLHRNYSTLSQPHAPVHRPAGCPCAARRGRRLWNSPSSKKTRRGLRQSLYVASAGAFSESRGSWGGGTGQSIWLTHRHGETSSPPLPATSIGIYRPGSFPCRDRR